MNLEKNNYYSKLNYWNFVLNFVWKWFMWFLLTLLSTAVAKSCSYFLGLKYGRCSSGRNGSPLWLSISGNLVTSSITRCTSLRSSKCLSLGLSGTFCPSHNGRSEEKMVENLFFVVYETRNHYVHIKCAENS